MKQHSETYADIPVGSLDGDWLDAMPGERLKVRVSSDETNGRYTVLELVAAPGSGLIAAHPSERGRTLYDLGRHRTFCMRQPDLRCGRGHLIYRSQGRPTHMGESVRNRHSDAGNVRAGRPRPFFPGGDGSGGSRIRSSRGFFWMLHRRPSYRPLNQHRIGFLRSVKQGDEIRVCFQFASSFTGRIPQRRRRLSLKTPGRSAPTTRGNGPSQWSRSRKRLCHVALR
jgi:hypothetical protein